MENRFSKYAQGQMIAPPDPKVPGQVTGQGLSNTKTADEIQRERALFEFNKRKAAAEAGLSEANLNRARNPTRAPPGAEVVADARKRYDAAVLFRKQLQEAHRLWKDGQQGDGLGGIADYFPSPRNKAFDAAVEPLKALGRTLFKTPGDQMTEFEGRPIVEMMPDRWSFDEKNAQRFNQLDAMAREIIAQNAPIVGKKVTYGKPRGRKRKTNVINFDDLPE